MIFSYFTLFVALSLSAIAAWYSIVGLTAIFAAAVVPIIIMGGALEVAKITVTIWLHEHWNRCQVLMKVYLTSAVILLMIITSMGIFGFLSRAHIEQGAPIGDSQAQIEIIDEKIAVEQEVIEQYRRDLTILNQQIERFSELGAVSRGVNARAAQQQERQEIFNRIEKSQSTITELRQQRAPLAADIRKIETEVGPIKYIAALIYGDNPDQNLLEKAVRWVIILLVVVFDPLAIMMVLAATESLKWRREAAPAAPAAEEPNYAPDDGPLTDEQIDQVQQSVAQEEKSILEQHPYLDKPFVQFDNLPPLVATNNHDVSDKVSAPEPEPPTVIQSNEARHDDTEDSDDVNDTSVTAQCKRLWKQDHPGMTLKEQRRLVAAGKLDHEPWMDYIEDPRIVRDTSFGTVFPEAPQKGDLHLKTSDIPYSLHKYNGKKWIWVDKNSTDQYVYNNKYIEFLISQISNGQYDPDLLSDAERSCIEERLRKE